MVISIKDVETRKEMKEEVLGGSVEMKEEVLGGGVELKKEMASLWNE